MLTVTVSLFTAAGLCLIPLSAALWWPAWDTQPTSDHDRATLHRIAGASLACGLSLAVAALIVGSWTW